MQKTIPNIVKDLLGNSNISKPPIDVDIVARTLGVKIRQKVFNDSGKISGMLYNDKGRKIIGVNGADSDSRKRFTIAHEIGHLVLHDDGMYLDSSRNMFLRNEKSSLGTDRREIEANQFAAELLMPTKMLKDELAKIYTRLLRMFNSVPTDMLVEQLATKFDVSSQAMAIRLESLSYLNKF